MTILIIKHFIFYCMKQNSLIFNKQLNDSQLNVICKCQIVNWHQGELHHQ